MATRKHVLVPLDLVRHSAHARCRHTWLNEAVTPPYDPSRQGRWREKRRCVATVVCWWTGRFKDGAWSPSDNIILSFKNRPKRYFEFWEFRPFKSACTLGFILLFSVIVDLWCLQMWIEERKKIGWIVCLREITYTLLLQAKDALEQQLSSLSCSSRLRTHS